MLTLLTVVAFALGFIAGRAHARTAYTHGLTRAFRLVDAESKKARAERDALPEGGIETLAQSGRVLGLSSASMVILAELENK